MHSYNLLLARENYFSEERKNVQFPVNCDSNIIEPWQPSLLLLKLTEGMHRIQRCFVWLTIFITQNQMHLYYQSFIYSTTDAPVSCLKNIKITLKFTLKQLRHVSVLQLHRNVSELF